MKNAWDQTLKAATALILIGAVCGVLGFFIGSIEAMRFCERSRATDLQQHVERLQEVKKHLSTCRILLAKWQLHSERAVMQSPATAELRDATAGTLQIMADRWGMISTAEPPTEK